MDVFLYNGEINRGSDLRFINLVAKHKQSSQCVVVLVTPGGDPDAAYKMGRYLQRRYDSFSVLISGLCKSAGTLFAIGANELIFAPYGELGPLDVQLAKRDQLTGMESGLNISEAFSALDQRARDTFVGTTLELIGQSGGVVSFQTASHSASEIVGALYGPIFARIDPEEVGSRARAMRTGADYGQRLNLKWNNLKPDALRLLSETYSSHGFVIDSLEAAELFERVRMATETEMKMVLDLGNLARHPQRDLTLRSLGTIATTPKEGEADEDSHEQKAGAGVNDAIDPSATVEGERPTASGAEESEGQEPAGAVGSAEENISL
ncbi:hypothetical protein ACC755_22750 [Rhizobium ruizarguesonis]